ncbi:hypothetical protein [Methylobacterium nodulans]|uniref:Growth inhibitor PemK n=1 Tax=Methylobacterium nodulans (strain LMG 21967 / CNCM I-2342 / ORS 2060) TaxID=460265 RepID=B8IJW2_METNO|nr:hypothetical protein [Methylobacterium nodulans]ACL59975.1 conserved hypothetical protein [Methylobacterium nodulans ORS 2060]
MTTDQFKEGHVVEYSYLWKWQAELDRTEGEKDRPACVAMMIKDSVRNLTHLVILPISGTPPKSDQIAIEIPLLELKRAGLTEAKRGWITVSEYNYDILERSWDFPINRPPLGRFSRPFLKQIQSAVLPTIRGKTGRVDRTM